MRKGSLELLAGGGTGSECDMCALGLYLDGTAADEATKATMLAELAKMPGRARFWGYLRDLGCRQKADAELAQARVDAVVRVLP